MEATWPRAEHLPGSGPAHWKATSVFGPTRARGKPKDVLAGENTISDIRPLSNGAVLYGTQDPVWGIISADGQAIRLGQPPIADLRSNIPNFRVSNDGATVAYSYTNAGRSPATFSVANREIHLLRGEPIPPSLHGPKLEGMRVTGWAGSFTSKIQRRADPAGPQ